MKLPHSVGALVVLIACGSGCSTLGVPAAGTFGLGATSNRTIHAPNLPDALDPLGLSLHVADNGQSAPAAGNVFNGYVGSVTAVGPLATFTQPTALAYVPDGSLYVADGTCFRRIAPDVQGRLTVSTVAGDLTQAGTNDGPVFQGRFGQVVAMVGMPDGALIVADGNRLRRMVFDGHGGGSVATIAGAVDAGYQDGDGATARFNQITSLTVTANGTVFATEASQLRQLVFDAGTGRATVSTLLPEVSSAPIAPVPTATPVLWLPGAPLRRRVSGPLVFNFSGITRVAAAPDGALWIIKNSVLHRLRRAADGNWAPDLAVTGTESSDRAGEATGAAFGSLQGLGVLPNGDVLLVDINGQALVRRVSVDGAGQAHVSLFAQHLPFPGPTRYWSWLLDGLSMPGEVAIGPHGEIRILDETIIREIDVDAAGNGKPTTFAGWPLQVKRQDGPAAATSLHPDAIVANGHGGYYMASSNVLYEMELTAMGGATTRFLAGNPALGHVDGVGDQVRFDTPNALLRLPDGSLVVNDYQSNYLRRVTFDAAGLATVSTLAGGGPANYAAASMTTGDGPALAATISPNRGLCLRPDGTIYFGDHYRVRKLARDAAGQLQVTTLAGVANIGILFKDGPGDQARFGAIDGITMDHNGALFVTDTDNSLIRKLVFDAAGKATVSTIAGLVTPTGPGLIVSPLHGYKDGPAATAMFYYPSDIDLAADGSLLVTDGGNNAIRRIAQDAAGTWQVSTLIGPAQGMQDGPFALARLNQPFELEPDGPDRYLCIEGGYPTSQLRTIRLGVNQAESGHAEPKITASEHPETKLKGADQ